jgi:hypothetical protein
MKDKNVYKFADLIPVLDYSAKDFYSFIASNICNTESKSNLNYFLGLKCEDEGSIALFANAKASYEMLGLDGNCFFDFYHRPFSQNWKY